MVWLLIGYMLLFIHRPFEVWPALGEIHLERLYMGVTLLTALVWPGKRWPPNRLHWAFAVFAVAVLVCWMTSPWTMVPEVDQVVENYLKILVFYVLVVCFVHTERDLRILLAGFLAVMAVYMGHSLLEYFNGRHEFRMGIVRMIGVDTTLGDPNSFGASILYSLPFLVAFWRGGRSMTLRYLLAGYLGLAMICIALTGSRSAFAGLILWALIAIARSRWRLPLALAALAMAPLLWSVMPESLQTRFETIVNPEVGPANAWTSAEGRIKGLEFGVQLWVDNPVTGCGPGAWRPATNQTIESHNFYGQVLGEMGTLGVLAFLAIVWGFWKNLRWARQAHEAWQAPGQDFLYCVAQAVGVAVILLLFEGNFSHNLYRYNWVWYGAFLVIACRCMEQRAQPASRSSTYWQAPTANLRREPSLPATAIVTAPATVRG